MNSVTNQRNTISPPLWLLAELTYRCPLHCVFCYNPVNYTSIQQELTTDEWKRVLREARALGAVQLGFSGGEPLLRDDLETLIAEAHQLGFYTNVITSGIGLNEKKIAAFKHAGLDHIQLSFQDSTQELNDFLSHTRTFELKKQVAALIKKYDYPMVMNCVLHRHNLPHIGQIIEMALALGAETLELANTQYYGWAMQNRHHLLPTHEQVLQAERVVNDYRKKIGNRCQLLFVVPDYFEERPKRCLNGWGTTFLGIAPDGMALPCHNARELPGMTFDNVREKSVRDIWFEGSAFNHFRGTDWMQEPCRSCDEKTKDFGGCRCQAYLLTGDARNADPVCALSPNHHLMTEIIQTDSLAPSPQDAPLLFRSDDNSRQLV